MMEKRKIKLYIYFVAKKGQSRNEGCPEAKVELPESRRMEQDGRMVFQRLPERMLFTSDRTCVIPPNYCLIHRPLKGLKYKIERSEVQSLNERLRCGLKTVRLKTFTGCLITVFRLVFQESIKPQKGLNKDGKGTQKT